MFSPYRQFNNNNMMQQNQDLQQYGTANKNSFISGNDFGDIASIFGEFMSKDGASKASGKMGGGKLGYANAITPWMDSNKSTGQKVGSSLGTAVGFYFGGPVGAQAGSWAGGKIGSWLGG